jgi:hypothetical protein
MTTTPLTEIDLLEKIKETHPNSHLLDLKTVKNKENKEMDDHIEKIRNLSTDLTSCQGIGIGLQTSYNMVQVMGGLLDCTATENQTKFFFSVTLEVALTGEMPFRTWSRKPSPYNSKRNSPFQSIAGSQKNSPYTSKRTSPFDSNKTSPQNDSGRSTQPG